MHLVPFRALRVLLLDLRGPETAVFGGQAPRAHTQKPRTKNDLLCKTPPGRLDAPEGPDRRGQPRVPAGGKRAARHLSVHVPVD